MAGNAKSLSLILVIGEIVCILTSLGIITYMYHQNALLFAAQFGQGDDNAIKFGIFVGVPSIAVFVAGAIMLKIGIQTGLKD